MNNELKSIKLNLKNFLIIIFLNIKDNSNFSQTYIIIFNFIEMINKIIIIDIIFNKHRNFLNYCSYLYLLSPMFYFEYINNLLVNKSNQFLNEDDYKYDQISLLLKKLFKINIYDQIYFSKFTILKIVIIFILTINYSLLIIKKTNFNKFKKICSMFIFFTYNPFINVLFLIYLRKLFEQFSFNYNDNDNNLYNFLLILFFFAFFILLFYLFYSLYFYSFSNNEIFYFYKSKMLLIKYCRIILETIIFTIRFKIIFSITIQFCWVIFYFLEFINFYNYYKYNLYKQKFEHINLIFDIIIISFIFIRFITFLLLLKSSINLNVFKFLEISLFIFNAILLFNILYNKEKIVKLSKLDFYFKNQDYTFIKGMVQILYPLNEVFSIKIKLDKISEKDKIRIIHNIYTKFQTNFLQEQKDYIYVKKTLKHNNSNKFIESGEEEENRILKVSTIYKSTEKIVDDGFEIDKFYQTLLKLINNYYDLSKENNDKFYYNIKELLMYYKILLYYLLEGKSFKIQYLYQKFIHSRFFEINKNLLNYSIFYYLDYHLNNCEKIERENNDEYILILLKLNSKYFKIYQHLKKFLLNFLNQNYENFIKITILKSKKIGNSIKKIKKLNQKMKKYYLKDNFEYDKFKFIEAILFNSGFEPNLEFFDFKNLDTITLNNKYFIILFEKGEMIVKKTPKNIYDLTYIKTTKFYNENFLNFFPNILKKSLKKEIKQNLLIKNSFKTNACIHSIDNYIVFIKLNFNRLPYFQGKLFIQCFVEFNNLKDNCYIINETGVLKYFGSYFQDNFELKLEKEKNIFKMLCLDIENVDEIDENNLQIFMIDIEKFIKNLDLIFSKKQNFEIIEKRFRKYLKKDDKTVHIKLNVVKKFISNYINYFLITIEFENIIFKRIVSKNYAKDNEEEKTNINISFSSLQSTSSISVLKDKYNSNWNITNTNENKNSNFSFNLKKVSFFYNLFLIILTIFICIFINIETNNYKNNYKNNYFFREFNDNFLYCMFYLSNEIILINSESEYYSNLLNNELSNLNININLNELYQLNCKNITTNLINLYNNDFKKLFGNKNNKIYKYATQNILLFSLDGNYQEFNYETTFQFYLNYFYLLSEIQNFSLYFPIIEKGNISYYNNLTIEQKYYFVITKNFFQVVEKLIFVNYLIKDDYLNTFNYLKVIIFIFILIFVACNIFSIVILYFSMKFINIKIYEIYKKIFSIDSKHIFYLKYKLKIVKILILNEIKASLAFEKIKNFALNSNEKVKLNRTNIDKSTDNLTNIKTDSNKELSKKLKENNNNQQMNDSNIEIQKEMSNDFKQYNLNIDNYLSQNNFLTSRKDYTIKKISSNYFVNILIILFIVYLIFFGCTSPFLFSYLKNIKKSLIELKNNDDIKSCLFEFYLITKFSIFFNDTDLYNNAMNMSTVIESFYDNFSGLMIELNNTNNEKKIDLVSVLNSENACSFIISSSEFSEEIIQICNNYDFLKTNYLIILGGLIKDFKKIYREFLISKRNEKEIVAFFHSYILQFDNIILIVYVIDTLVYVHNVIIDHFNDYLYKLSNCLTIMFVIMILIAIINYFQSNFYILNLLSDRYCNFLIIEQFFVFTDPEKKK